MYLILHEGGHAQVHLILEGEVDVFYAHPFALFGYVRPMWSALMFAYCVLPHQMSPRVYQTEVISSS